MVVREIPIGCNDQEQVYWFGFFSFQPASPSPCCDRALFQGFPVRSASRTRGNQSPNGSGESILLLNSAWCFMPLVHYLMETMMR